MSSDFLRELNWFQANGSHNSSSYKEPPGIQQKDSNLVNDNPVVGSSLFVLFLDCILVLYNRRLLVRPRAEAPQQ